METAKSATSFLARTQWLSPEAAATVLWQGAPQYGFSGVATAPPKDARRVRQVHGTTIVAAGSTAPPLLAQLAADGIFTDVPGDCVAVRTADCLPILLRSQNSCAVAAVHAGWRGLTAGILQQAVHLFAEHKVAPSDLQVIVGPAISRERFEVGDDVREALISPLFGLSACQAALSLAKGRGDRWHVDLAVAAVFALGNAGVPAEQIAVIQACTYSDSNWHSYRREGKGCGANYSWIRA